MAQTGDFVRKRFSAAPRRDAIDINATAYATALNAAPDAFDINDAALDADTDAASDPGDLDSSYH